MMDSFLRDRTHAGELLARRLGAYAGRPDVVVLALPRGGVPVGFTLARALDVPLDVLLVRKLGIPGHEESALGAITSGGVYVLQPDIVSLLGISPKEIEGIAQREMAEIERREKLYRSSRPALELEHRTVILVDDGLATGSTMTAAVQALRAKNPARVIVAVPVGAAESCRALRTMADEFICLRMPEDFYAVSLWYEKFPQISDAEVCDLLSDAAKWPQRHAAPPSALNGKNNSGALHGG
jgi:putative phosphoribosyl transferase